MKQYGIETLHEHRASLEQKARFSGFPCTLGIFPTEIRFALYGSAAWKDQIMKPLIELQNI